MAFANINPLAAIWRNMGLNCLLQEQKSDPAIWLQRDFAPLRPQTPSAARPATSRAQGPVPPAPAPEPKVEAPSAAPWHPLPVEEWPQDWRRFAEVFKKGLIVWTYLKLGNDLCPDPNSPDGEGRAARSAFMHRIFQDLNYPKGTHTFWPVRLPGDTDESDDLFWSGVNMLGSRGVVVMGSPAANFILPGGGLKPLTQMRHRRRLVWVLWDIDTLIAQPGHYARVLAFLRNALRPVAGKVK